MRRSIVALSMPLALVACQSSVPLTDTAVPPVTAATQEWALAVSSCDVQRIVRLYDAQAVVWDIGSRAPLDSPSAIRSHFDRLCASSGAVARITLNEQRPRTFGSVAVNSGTYTITPARAAEPPFPVRFSFGYRLGADGWRIVDHHASAFPPPLVPR